MEVRQGISNDTISEVGAKDMQDYIFEHTKVDEKKLLFKHKSILGLPASLVAQQIASRRKAEAKLPTLYQTKGIVYPATLNLEQSSSEITAKFKAEIVQRESKVERPLIADLTGGFGIDSFFFSNLATAVDYVEPNDELCQIVQHNFRILEKENVHFHAKTAEDFLAENSRLYDCVYLDPSRRDTKARKVFGLSDCAPNISLLLPRLLEQTNLILLKTSPLLDITQGLRELRGVKKIVVVSVANDCKELLFLIEKNFIKEPFVHTINLDHEGKIKQAFDFSFSEEEVSISEFGTPQRYLYEPNSSVLKAGAFKLLGHKFGLKKLQVNTHLYTSELLISDFPGRTFEVYDIDGAAKPLAGKYANIISRNYPLSPDDLKKKLRTKDGGENYVIAFSGLKKKYIVIAKRLA